MLKIAQQTIHRSDGTPVATEVLARLLLGQTVLTPPTFMADQNDESWFALDIEVLRLTLAYDVCNRSPGAVFVNISAPTLDSEAFFRLYQSKLMEVEPATIARLVIEIPETSSLVGKGLVNRLVALKHTGVRVAIDDFGQLHANQERLESFDWDFCKIDLPAIQVTANMNWMDVAIKHCNATNTHLIMEKIESEGDIAHLLQPVKRQAWFQGYCFSRPEVVALRHPVGVGQHRFALVGT